MAVATATVTSTCVALAWFGLLVVPSFRAFFLKLLPPGSFRIVRRAHIPFGTLAMAVAMASWPGIPGFPHGLESLGF